MDKADLTNIAIHLAESSQQSLFDLIKRMQVQGELLPQAPVSQPQGKDATHNSLAQGGMAGQQEGAAVSDSARQTVLVQDEVVHDGDDAKNYEKLLLNGTHRDVKKDEHVLNILNEVDASPAGHEVKIGGCPVPFAQIEMDRDPLVELEETQEEERSFSEGGESSEDEDNESFEDENEDSGDDDSQSLKDSNPGFYKTILTKI